MSNSNKNRGNQGGSGKGAAWGQLWEQLALRLQLEAEACFWQIRGANNVSQRRQLEARGKAAGRFLRGLSGKKAEAGLSWNVVARWYQVAAEAARLAGQAEAVSVPPQWRVELVRQLARCQSALLQIAELHWRQVDRDQRELFLLTHQCLQRWAIQERVRHLRLEEPVSLEHVAGVDAVLKHLRKEWNRNSRQEELLAEMEYQWQVCFAQGGDVAELAVKKIIGHVEALAALGCPMSNPRIRQVLRGVQHALPAELPAAVRQVLALLEKEASASCLPKQRHEQPRAPADSVCKVRRLLAGKRVVFIGGKSRPKAKDAIVRAFALKELVWHEARSGESRQRLEPLIASSSTVLVITTIRWNSHGHVEAADSFCRKFNKPLVRLPAGYNPNAIAHEILIQCSRKLEGNVGGPTGQGPPATHAG